MTIDLDSTICEVHGKQKQGAAYGYTRAFGYHPILATRADTGEMLHARLRKGSSQRGHKRFVEELIARVRRAGATGTLTVRGDSGFWSYALIDTLHRLGVHWSITVVDQQGDPGAHRRHRRDRLGHDPLPRRRRSPSCGDDHHRRQEQASARPCGSSCAAPGSPTPPKPQLWPDWRHHAFITDLDLAVVEMDQFHRDHATVELAIRDLKDGAGLEHCPSGKFFANAAWLACAVLAHNLTRWTARLGGIHPDEQLTVTRTVRTRVLALPGRLVNRSGRHVLRLPARWPWQATFNRALDQLRALPMLS